MPTLRVLIFAKRARNFCVAKTAKWVAFLLRSFLWRRKEKNGPAGETKNSNLKK
jgi:hypothetical protein